jgi:pimeloyl-ACP methyl ester carboxylesterase
VFANGGNNSRTPKLAYYRAPPKLAYYRLSWIPPTLPLHFVVPASGAVIPDWAITQRAREVPHATTTVIDGAGHLIVQETPALLGGDLAQFLASVEARGRAKL